MAETMVGKSPNERSKSFPVIPLRTAIDRLVQFEKKFGRHPAPFEKSGLAWGLEEGSSQANRIMAALKSFGLIDYSGSGKERTISISESARTYLRAQQDSIKKEVLKAAALKPKQIAKFWPEWGIDRPVDEICLDRLVLKEGFTETSAPQFLKVYDETIKYAGLVSSDKVEVEDDVGDDDDEEEAAATSSGDAAEFASGSGRGRGGLTRVEAPVAPQITLAPGERVLTTGLLARDATFRLLVSGRVGPKEIEILIKKLELDKEILADRDETS
ncbi:MAG: hypothetical protein JSR89_01560 [Proteobacteria bacterium]|nr:hypothetical protein [Pseudomonadota bacterium]